MNGHRFPIGAIALLATFSSQRPAITGVEYHYGVIPYSDSQVIVIRQLQPQKYVDYECHLSKEALAICNITTTHIFQKGQRIALSTCRQYSKGIFVDLSSFP